MHGSATLSSVDEAHHEEVPCSDFGRSHCKGGISAEKASSESLGRKRLTIQHHRDRSGCFALTGVSSWEGCAGQKGQCFPSGPSVVRTKGYKVVPNHDRPHQSNPVVPRHSSRPNLESTENRAAAGWVAWSSKRSAPDGHRCSKTSKHRAGTL